MTYRKYSDEKCFSFLQHDAFGPRLHRIHAIKESAPASLHGKGRMAELELPDWKYLRSLRLIAVDHQGSMGTGMMSFVDLSFLRHVKGRYWGGKQITR